MRRYFPPSEYETIFFPPQNIRRYFSTVREADGAGILVAGRGCDALLTGFLPGDKGPYALTPNTVELIPTLEG